MNLELNNKRVVVTGGSRGIGRAIAEAFLSEGALVAICARKPEGLESATLELSKRGTVFSRTADIGQEGQPAEFIEWASRELGGIDILVSNVSAMSTDFRASVEVDIMGVNALITATLPHMQSDAGCNLICIASRAASVGIPALQSYSAVKAATVSMVKSLAIELAPRGIRANVVSPGDIEFEGGTWGRAKENNPRLYQSVLRQNPLGRLGRPEEIADTVAFVASHRGSFITGANILVDGGATTSLQI